MITWWPKENLKFGMAHYEDGHTAYYLISGSKTGHSGAAFLESALIMAPDSHVRKSPWGIRSPSARHQIVTYTAGNTTGNIHRDGVWEWQDSSGRSHREQDLPAIFNESGLCLWYQHGWLHRMNGPAVLNTVVHNTSSALIGHTSSGNKIFSSASSKPIKSTCDYYFKGVLIRESSNSHGRIHTGLVKRFNHKDPASVTTHEPYVIFADDNSSDTVPYSDFIAWPDWTVVSVIPDSETNEDLNPGDFVFSNDAPVRSADVSQAQNVVSSTITDNGDGTFTYEDIDGTKTIVYNIVKTNIVKTTSM